MGVQSGGRTCVVCGAMVESGAWTCGECSAAVRASAEDLRAFADAERSRDRRRKAMADLFFLAGLLGGGPLLSTGRMQPGLFLVLGGGLASVVRRYVGLSTLGSALIGFLTSAVIAAVVIEPGQPGTQESGAREGERRAYATELAARYEVRSVAVEPRGPGLITIWFHVPATDLEGCGAVPLPPERDRLAALGFVRVVVVARTEEGRICTFRP